MLIQGQVGPLPNASITDGQNPNLLQGKFGELIVAEAMAKYYTMTYRGAVFHGASAAAGILIPISTTTAPTFALWNPSGSGKNAVLLKFLLGWVSTTGAPGSVLYMFKTGVGASIGTPISAFATVAGNPVNGLLGSGNASSMLFAPATATINAAGTVLRPMGVSQLTTTGTATFGTATMVEDFEGTIIVPPGVLFYIAGSAALLSLFAHGLIWAEVPV